MSYRESALKMSASRKLIQLIFEILYFSCLKLLYVCTTQHQDAINLIIECKNLVAKICLEDNLCG